MDFPSFIFIDDRSLVRAYQNNVLRSQMEVGPQKTRPIQSKPLMQISFNVSIHVDDLNNFNNWFYDDIGSGAYWFMLKDPFTGENKRFRFSSSEFAWSKVGNVLTSSFVLEAYDGIQ